MPVPDIAARPHQLPGDYVSLRSQELPGGAAAWLSPGDDDPVWDAFLETTPLGHFQQSSMWARAKAIGGWQPIRVVLSWAGGIVGGFQILHRHSRVGRIGYISKGPVLTAEEPCWAGSLLDLVTRTVKANHLRALILQPPDEGGIRPAALARIGLLPDRVCGVISATVVFDVTGGIQTLKEHMRRSTIQEIRLAETRGLTEREGNERDIGSFFRLMVTTCERQHTAPNPASEEAMRHLWNSFRSQGKIRLSIAELNGEPVAGGLCIGFGRRATFWKKGWSGQHPDRKPNHLLMVDALRWAHDAGYPLLDCAAIDRKIATKMLRNEPFSTEDKKSRHYFLLGFGGRPLLLPEANIYIKNRMARFGYRAVMSTAWGRSLGQRVMGGLSR